MIRFSSLSKNSAVGSVFCPASTLIKCGTPSTAYPTAELDVPKSIPKVGDIVAMARPFKTSKNGA